MFIYHWRDLDILSWCLFTTGEIQISSLGVYLPLEGFKYPLLVFIYHWRDLDILSWCLFTTGGIQISSLDVYLPLKGSIYPLLVFIYHWRNSDILSWCLFTTTLKGSWYPLLVFSLILCGYPNILQENRFITPPRRDFNSFIISLKGVHIPTGGILIPVWVFMFSPEEFWFLYGCSCSHRRNFNSCMGVHVLHVPTGGILNSFLRVHNPQGGV